MSFKDLKNRSQNSMASLSKKLQDLNKGDQFKDERFWKPTVDKLGNATATIRFLPGHKEEGIEFVRYWNHGFKHNGQWFIENCPTTIGQPCPVCEANSKLWQTEIADNQKIASYRKRKLSHVSNIFIINDPGNPENNGKVFLFRYGKKIFDVIANKITPKFADETPFNPFDLWTGANFKLRQKLLGDYPNFDDSVFEAPKALGTDKMMEDIYGQQHKLSEFVDPKNFKTYAELEAKFSPSSAGGKDQKKLKRSLDEEDGVTPSRPAREPAGRSASEPRLPTNDAKEEVADAADTEGEDPLEYFKKLASDE